MKTIRVGNPDVVKAYRYFECNKCDWAGKAEKGEYEEITQCNIVGIYVNCPCCERQAGAITDRVKIEQLLKEERRLEGFYPWQR